MYSAEGQIKRRPSRMVSKPLDFHILFYWSNNQVIGLIICKGHRRFSNSIAKISF